MSNDDRPSGPVEPVKPVHGRRRAEGSMRMNPRPPEEAPRGRRRATPRPEAVPSFDETLHGKVIPGEVVGESRKGGDGGRRAEGRRRVETPKRPQVESAGGSAAPKRIGKTAHKATGGKHNANRRPSAPKSDEVFDFASVGGAAGGALAGANGRGGPGPHSGGSGAPGPRSGPQGARTGHGHTFTRAQRRATKKARRRAREASDREWLDAEIAEGRMWPKWYWKHDRNGFIFSALASVAVFSACFAGVSAVDASQNRADNLASIATGNGAPASDGGGDQIGGVVSDGGAGDGSATSSESYGESSDGGTSNEQTAFIDYRIDNLEERDGMTIAHVVLKSTGTVPYEFDSKNLLLVLNDGSTIAYDKDQTGALPDGLLGATVVPGESKEGTVAYRLGDKSRVTDVDLVAPQS